MDGVLRSKIISKRFAYLSTKAKGQKRSESATGGFENRLQSNL